LYSTWVTRPVSGSTPTFEATVCASTSTRPVCSAFASVLPALYFACTGQIGTQLMLPWQRPPSSTCEVETAPTGLKPLPPS
jgi:hypothetical protein